MIDGWEFTNDPDDACSLCVVWEEQPDDVLGENARPIWPDGSTVERIYRFVHRQCQMDAIEYSMSPE